MRSQLGGGPGSLGEFLEVQGFIEGNHIFKELNLKLLWSSFISERSQNFSIIFSVVLQLVLPKEVSIMSSARLGRPIVSHVIKELAIDEVNVKRTERSSLSLGPESVDCEALAEWYDSY